MQKLNKETATAPRGELEVASLRYGEYKVLTRKRQLEPLITRIVEDATDEEVSTVRSFLQWTVRQLKDRAKVSTAA